MASTERTVSLPIQGGARTVVVDTWPLEESFSFRVGSFSTRKIVEPCMGSLLIKPNWKQRLGGLVSSALGGVLLFAGGYGVWFMAAALWELGVQRGGWAPWLRVGFAVVAGLFGVLFGLVGLLIFVIGLAASLDLRSYRFDVYGGLLTYGLPGWRRRRRLDQVLAVQIVRHGQASRVLASDSEFRIFRRSDGSSGISTDASYQLNLVLDDPDQPRLSLSHHGTLNWTWEAATKLADLLQVPLLDCICAAEATVIEPERLGQQVERARAERPAPSLVAEVAPLLATAISIRLVTLAQPDPDLLVIKPSALSRLLLTPFMLGLPLAVSAVFWWNFGQMAQQIGVWGAVLVCLAPLAFLPLTLVSRSGQFRFDRLRRALTYGRIWSRKTKPFSDILAVQVIFGGRHEATDPDTHITRGFETYQLNLVLKDPPGSRINVSNHPGRRWTQEAGQRLAEFLGVPLLDQLSLDG